MSEAAAYSTPNLTVESLAPADLTDEVVVAMQGLLLATYEHTFEHPTAGQSTAALRPGSVRAHLFDPEDPQRRTTYRERVTEHITARGSEYWLGHRPGDSRLVSLAKVTPSRATRRQKLGWQSPNAFINDIVVDPELHGQLIGTHTLVAALTHSGHDYQPERRVALHAFRDNPLANQWFARLGLAPTAHVEPLQLGNQHLAQDLWESGPRGVGNIVDYLRVNG